MKRNGSITPVIGVLLAAALLALASHIRLPDPVADSARDDGVAQPVAILQQRSQPGALHGLFVGSVEPRWTVRGAFSDTLSTPTAGSPEAAAAPDLGYFDLGLQLSTTSGSVEGFVDLEHTLVYTKEATIMATPVGPTPLPGVPALQPVPLGIGPQVAGLYLGSQLALASPRIMGELAGEPVERQFVIAGEVTFEDDAVLVRGEYKETIWGALPEPITVLGDFQLRQGLFPDPEIPPTWTPRPATDTPEPTPVAPTATVAATATAVAATATVAPETPTAGPGTATATSAATATAVPSTATPMLGTPTVASNTPIPDEGDSIYLPVAWNGEPDTQ